MKEIKLHQIKDLIEDITVPSVGANKNRLHKKLNKMMEIYLSQQKKSKHSLVDEMNIAITFGKHIGLTLGSILNNDPGYIVWLYDKTDFTISEELNKLAADREDKIWEDVRDEYRFEFCPDQF